ncbi:MAG: hypothetical protein V2G43_07675 [bacterium JZ-2024 1]
MKGVKVGMYVILILVGLLTITSGTYQVVPEKVKVSPDSPEGDTFAWLSTMTLEYERMKGRYPSLQDLKAERLLIYDIRNPYTGEELQDACQKPVIGGVCFQTEGPYRLRGYYLINKEGKAITTFPSKEPWEIAPEGQDRPLWVYHNAKVLGYGEEEMKLVFLGSVIFDGLMGRDYPEYVEKGGWEATRLGREPFRTIIDPITGEKIQFNGKGYGERVKFVPGRSEGSLQIQVWHKGKMVYQAEVGLSGEEGKDQMGRPWKTLTVGVLLVPRLDGKTPPLPRSAPF